MPPCSFSSLRAQDELDGSRTMDDFLRAAVEDYICNHRFAGGLSNFVRNQEAEEDQP